MGGNPATPSKACQPCRAKRRKCDLMRPGCSQCRRANIECGGYRDSFSLRLRDETALAARKTHERIARSRTASPKSAGFDETVVIPALVVRKLPDTPETLALGYFMHIYAPTASFEYLAEVSSTYLTTEPLRDALLAPSLLLYSQNLRDPSLQSLAQSHYATALKSTNSALSNPDQATSDSTLLAVLLLGLFEALVFRGRAVPMNWNVHTRGALELLRLRGDRQFDTSLGCHLFRHASLNIRAHCAHVGVKSPSTLSTLESAHLGQMYPNGRTRQFGTVIDGIANLRAKIRDTPLGEEFLELLELDGSINDILENLQRELPFEVIDATAIRKTICSYNGLIHRYLSPRIARSWNAIRMVKLFITQMLHNALKKPQWLGDLPEEARTRAEALVTITAPQMISDILNSVPYILDMSADPALSARSLIYPLSGVAMFEFTPSDAAKFAINRLDYIGRQYGLPQAIDSANMVLQANDLEDWIHLSLLS